MVSPTPGTIRNYFAKLGMEPEIADLYLALYTHGPQTISELARTSGVERTRIYRLIDSLLESNLFEVESQNKRGIIKAAPISNLRMHISQKEHELGNLKEELSLIEQTLSHNTLTSPATRVQSYNNQSGIRQMLWNELNAKSEIVCINYRILEEGTGKNFMERWTEEFEKRGLRCRFMGGDSFLTSWKQGQLRAGHGTGQRVGGMEYHYLPPTVYRITYSMDVYDNVTAYYNWAGGDVYGFEIYNQDIADSHRRVFEMLWPHSILETRY